MLELYEEEIRGGGSTSEDDSSACGGSNSLYGGVLIEALVADDVLRLFPSVRGLTPFLLSLRRGHVVTLWNPCNWSTNEEGGEPSGAHAHQQAREKKGGWKAGTDRGKQKQREPLLTLPPRMIERERQYCSGREEPMAAQWWLEVFTHTSSNTTLGNGRKRR